MPEIETYIDVNDTRTPEEQRADAEAVRCIFDRLEQIEGGDWPRQIESTGRVLTIEARELDARRHIADKMVGYANTLWCLNDREASEQCWKTVRTIRQTISLLEAKK
jgi:hypothetical protein